ncbi:MAG: protein-(glutamine-N5) methyltransferase, release factor-specific [Phycisphaerae bacterium]|nr:protein-(glutamine-N5) methyltransferase, release factor-specific [Phycisphaerae bacterium]
MSDESPWTTRRLLKWIRDHLEAQGVDSPRVCSELMVSAAIRCERLRLYMEPDRVATDAEREVLRDWVRRASRHEPVQYLVGETWFRGHRFEVDSSTLIPRPSTETLVEAAASHLAGLDHPALILEPCTGTGCAGLSLLLELDRPHRAAARMREADDAIRADARRLAAAVGETIGDESPEDGAGESLVRQLPGESARVLATDLVPAAVSLATRNAESLGLADRYEARVGSLFEPVAPTEAGSFDLVFANPPYVSDVEYDRCPPNVRDHEPSTSLRGGVDGLDVIRPLVADAPRWLRAGGALAIEMQFDQGERVVPLFEDAGFRDIAVRQDVEGHERVVVGRLPV